MDRYGETRRTCKTCHFRRAAITHIFESNCSSSVKTHTQETDALTGMLSLHVYFICATCHVVFIYLSLVKWACSFDAPEPGVLFSAHRGHLRMVNERVGTCNLWQHVLVRTDPTARSVLLIFIFLFATHKPCWDLQFTFVC